MIQYQTATTQHTRAIALLHAQSWQQNYRGIMADDYLDNKVEQERLAVWRSRLVHPAGNQCVIIAKENEMLCGFACTYLNEDPVYGSLLDNIHVSEHWKRQGIGRALMRISAKWIQQQNPLSSYYLWVLEENAAAIHFYEQLGGKKVEKMNHPMPDGGIANAFRYFWKNLDALVD